MVRAKAGKSSVGKNYYQKLFNFCQSKQIRESFCLTWSVSVFHQNQKMRHFNLQICSGVEEYSFQFS